MFVSYDDHRTRRQGMAAEKLGEELQKHRDVEVVTPSDQSA